MSDRGSISSLLFQQLFLGALALLWLDKICKIVPQPYLDEVFHVRQAKAYIDNQWNVWDPKITTPPGVYLVSYVQSILLKLFAFEDYTSPAALRCLNAVVGGGLLLVLVRQLLHLIAGSDDIPPNEQKSRSAQITINNHIGHTAVNICLFPPLFFFYGLYYTDVLSAFSVLYAYHCHLRKEYIKVIFAGLASLLFRQTNVFWVAVFLGGLELVRTLPRGRPDVEFPRRAAYHDVVLGSWHHARVFDPLVGQASFEDYLKTAISLAIVTAVYLFTNTMMVFWNLSSYVLVLLAFLEFVVWNGGVVLGDKENHIASVHLAQMLYIWPYFLFFSLPLLTLYLVNALIPQSRIPPILANGSLQSQLPRTVTAVLVLAPMLAIVHYNTIVHPFTLADNRHYMFYIFRILLRHPLIRYLAVPIYLIPAWACLIALGISPVCNMPSNKPISPREKAERIQFTSTRVSFSLIWLITTALSLCTAPLVEPRYLIVPWLIWRMHMMLSLSSDNPAASESSELTAAKFRPSSEERRDTTKMKDEEDKVSKPRSSHPLPWQLNFTASLLWLETAWFLIISFTTGYIFLYWGFEWPQEPGRVQRFMW